MEEFASMGELLREFKGEPLPKQFRFARTPLQESYLFKNGIIFCVRSREKNDFLAAVEVFIKGKRNLLLNADSGANDFVAGTNISAPSVSFACISRLFSGVDTRRKYKEAIGKIGSGKVLVLDFRPDSRIRLSMKETRAARHGMKLRPPAPGYTMLGHEWHRPSTVLLGDVKTGICYLLGQDENQYFGVQLAGKVKTVDEAMIDLQPPEIRGKKFQRQGEWFIVPVKNEPRIPKALGNIEIAGEKLILKRESPQSNPHHIIANDVRFTASGEVYTQDLDMEHDQHDTVSQSGWAKIVRNTAVRSVSEDGVD